MPQVAILDRATQIIRPFDSVRPDLADALEVAGLPLHKVDFGTIAPSFNIIAYEFGLFEGTPDSYFRLKSNLYSGNVILFRTNEEGETIDFAQPIINHLNDCTEVEYFASLAEIESAIAANRVLRPQTSYNSKVAWTWTGHQYTRAEAMKMLSEHHDKYFNEFFGDFK